MPRAARLDAAGLEHGCDADRPTDRHIAASMRDGQYAIPHADGSTALLSRCAPVMRVCFTLAPGNDMPKADMMAIPAAA